MNVVGARLQRHGSWWHTAGVSAIASTTSSVNSRGCGLVNRIRSALDPTGRAQQSAKAPRSRNSTP